jgi:hypothetical protein
MRNAARGLTLSPQQATPKSAPMQNNDPKSENAAMKERAGKDKDQRGRQHDTIPHQHPARAGHGAEIKDAAAKTVKPESDPGK